MHFFDLCGWLFQSGGKLCCLRGGHLLCCQCIGLHKLCLGNLPDCHRLIDLLQLQRWVIQSGHRRRNLLSVCCGHLLRCRRCKLRVVSCGHLPERPRLHDLPELQRRQSPGSHGIYHLRRLHRG